MQQKKGNLNRDGGDDERGERNSAQLRTIERNRSVRKRQATNAGGRRGDYYSSAAIVSLLQSR
jgi:hypothetical protein